MKQNNRQSTINVFSSNKNDNLTVKDREFVCTNCGNKKDRDIHAANNMIYFYLKYYNASGTDVYMPVKRVKFSKQILKQESTASLV